jgi:soluble lytic murein transglycosylase-like protein
MPATARDLGVDPLNPTSAIDGAGKYLRQLYDALGSWEKALAAYNWGVGNVTRKGMPAAPTETQNYIREILADVDVA